MDWLRDAIAGWGTTLEERSAAFPCDGHLERPDRVVHRAIDVGAPPSVVFRWLCQLRAAPYSYDWIDNWGRRSPRRLTPGLDELEVGQRFMDIFNLTEFEPGVQVTIRADSAVFGQIAISYVVGSRGKGESRLVVKVMMRFPRNPLGLVWRCLLPAGDLVMMRKQLRTLAALAKSKRVGVGPGR